MWSQGYGWGFCLQYFNLPVSPLSPFSESVLLRNWYCSQASSTLSLPPPFPWLGFSGQKNAAQTKMLTKAGLWLPGQQGGGGQRVWAGGCGIFLAGLRNFSWVWTLLPGPAGQLAGFSQPFLTKGAERDTPGCAQLWSREKVLRSVFCHVNNSYLKRLKKCHIIAGHEAYVVAIS